MQVLRLDHERHGFGNEVALLLMIGNGGSLKGVEYAAMVSSMPSIRKDGVSEQYPP